LFASLGGSFIIRRALQPVTSVVQTAKHITADDLSLRIEAKNQKDEIGALVATFNDMIARLEKSVRKIRQFSGDVSHELRTPLTIIRGEIEVVLRKARSAEEYHETLESVLDETHHMEKIIDDLLFLSRLEATDKIEFSDDVELNEILSRVWDSRSPAAREKGIELKMLPSSPSRIRGERTLLERLLTNLVDNAVRYTPAGGNVVMGVEERGPWLVLTVRDTGIGIPEESLPLIFDRFYVVDPSRSKESGGSGLGLSIVKSVADIHGAVIDIRSRVEEGTTFTIRFPLAEGRT
jgi:heavy metal sensor kinase